MSRAKRMVGEAMTIGEKRRRKMYSLINRVLIILTFLHINLLTLLR